MHIFNVHATPPFAPLILCFWSPPKTPVAPPQGALPVRAAPGGGGPPRGGSLKAGLRPPLRQEAAPHFF